MTGKALQLLMAAASFCAAGPLYEPGVKNVERK